MTKITVVICDDQPLILSSLKLILETDPHIHVIGTASNGQAGLEMVRELNPTVALMDIQMPQMDGIEATKLIASTTQTKVIVLTTFNRDDYLFDAMDAGASGFLLKMRNRNCWPPQCIRSQPATGCSPPKSRSNSSSAIPVPRKALPQLPPPPKPSCLRP
ncbi:response regulator [Glutamicibacter arilaitensis]|uniref:response regulator n=1 Tax=Glutamicibacter arilaitensis TaxID=256701 RepID=UPI003FD2AADC